MEWKRIRRRFISRKSFLYCVVLLSGCCLLHLISTRPLFLDIENSSVRAKEYDFQELVKEKKATQEREQISTRFRRHLNGLGSYPPRCMGKCGKCTPCKPVHVPVPPGTPTPTEYYPEAWRCKCGNKYYMP